MSSLNDGGPAFPVDSTSHLDYPSICGMTLLDRFAMMDLPVDENGDWLGWFTGKTIQDAFGSPPDRMDGVASLEWLANVEARIRYMRAQAMMTERKRLYAAQETSARRPRCPACGSAKWSRDGDWDNETGEQTSAYMTCQTCGHSGPIE